MSKITRQSYKRKKIVMGFALFGAIGLVSTGFAAWVLSGSTDKSSETSLSVGTVSDKSMSFGDIAIYETGDTSKTALDPATFLFEPAAGDHTGRVRTDGAAQRLSLTAETTLSQAQNLGTLTASVAFANAANSSTAGQSNYESAVTKGYVVLPAASYVLYDVNANPVNPGNVQFDTAEEKTASFTYTVAFQWGSFFGGMNPSEFFDSATLGGAAGDKAGSSFEDSEVKTILDDLHALLDGVTVTLTLEAQPN